MPGSVKVRRALALPARVDGPPAEQYTPEGVAVARRTLARAHLALGTVPGSARNGFARICSTSGTGRSGSRTCAIWARA